jgi:hypothetical protein
MKEGTGQVMKTFILTGNNTGCIKQENKLKKEAFLADYKDSGRKDCGYY